MRTETAPESACVNFADDADTISCDGRERIVSSWAAGCLCCL